MRPRPVWLLAAALLLGRLPAAPVVLADCESVTGWKANAPAAVAAATDAGAGQGAVQVTLPGTVVREIVARGTAAMADWDRYQGISLLVKGDGSANFGCFAVSGGGSDGTYSYVTWFPLRDTTWHRVAVRWADLIPEGQVDPIGTLGALPPSGITVLRCGSRWTIGHNNYPLPQVSFGLDQVQLEETLPEPAATPPLAPLSGVIAKLKAGQPLRIQCMGDSITAGTSLPDRENQRYAVLVGRLLRDWCKNEQIVCESRAVGGAKLSDARAWVPRDFVDAPPDLVTVLYGYNDKSNTQTRDYYRRSLEDYLDRIARVTGGRSAVLLLTCLPGTGPRWSMLDDYAEAVREVAKARSLACFEFQDVLKSVGRDQLEQFFADQAHPNIAGHERLADALAGYLARQAGITPPPPAPKPVVEPGTSRAWNFEEGPGEWRLDGDDVKLVEGTAKSGKLALHFTMTAPAPDHRRAWSPWQAVQPGQTYRIGVQVHYTDVGTGRMGLYVAWRPGLDSDSQPQIAPVRAAAQMLGQWEPVSSEITVPPGVGAMCVLLWSPKEGTGTYWADDVTVEAK
ncbi:MAG: hypothetical protein IT204_00240 [Fimbriimonadaceae bacterium]|nr:hypothetical protein [Fimbriimonadaceae bacterium]